MVVVLRFDCIRNFIKNHLASKSLNISRLGNGVRLDSGMGAPSKEIINQSVKVRFN